MKKHHHLPTALRAWIATDGGFLLVGSIVGITVYFLWGGSYRSGYDVIPGLMLVLLGVLGGLMVWRAIRG